MTRLLVAAVITCVGLACETPKMQLYRGDALPADQVATILEDPDVDVEVVTVNGKNVHGSEFEILPGTYEVVLEARRSAPIEIPGAMPGQRRWLVATCTLTFQARAGQTYVAKSSGSYTSAGSGVYSGSLIAWLELRAKKGSRVGQPDCALKSGDMFI